MSDERATGDGPTAEPGGGTEPRAESTRSERGGGFASSESVPTDAAATAAYDAGRRLLDPMTVQAGRDAHVSVRTYIGVGGLSSTPGPVPVDQLVSLRASYARVAGYEKLLDHLRSRRLLVLAGPESSGRSTTALHLLDGVTDGAVSRLEPGTAATDLDDAQVEVGHGYLGGIDLSDGEKARVAADRLAALLERRGASCVLVARPSPVLRRALVRYWADCPGVAPLDILAGHLGAGVRPEEDLDEWRTSVPDDPEIEPLIGPAARPAEVAEIAGFLLQEARDEITRHEVRARTQRLLFDDRFAEWFTVLGGAPHGMRAQRARHLTAMRVAVAVFDGMPRHVAEETARNLAAHLARPAPIAGSDPEPVRPSDPPLLDPDATTDLTTSSSIVFELRDVPHRRGSVPGEIACYRDPRTAARLLQWVWTEQHAVRAPVTRWLAGLAEDGRTEVRLRAAQAAGLLCTVDFTGTMPELVQPAAVARPERFRAAEAEDDEDDDGVDGNDTSFRRRHFAAVAMDQAARDDRLRHAVRRRLSTWRRDDDPALRWTAAIALGHDVGAREPKEALDELWVLGTPRMSARYRELEATGDRRRAVLLRHEDEVFHAAGSGVAGLFRTGAHRQVIERLTGWMDDRWSSGRLLALQSVVYLIGMRVSDVGRPEAEDGGRSDDLVTEEDRQQRAAWPVLLALHRAPGELARPSAALIHAALRSRDRTVAFDVLSEWFELAAEELPARDALDALLAHLVRAEADRARLVGFVRQLRRRWEDPLPEETADHLQAVIENVPVLPGEEVLV